MSDNRNIYYAAKELGDQEVDDFKYEKLRQVSITFILEENTTPNAPSLSKVQFVDVNTHEVYSDLITLYEVNLNKIKNDPAMPQLLHTLSAFLTIKTHDDLCMFINGHNNEYAQRLVI